MRSPRARDTSQIRYYKRIGVLPEPERVSGRRRYDEGIIHRLGIIDVAQRAGLTLEEIADLTGPHNTGREARRVDQRVRGREGAER